MRMKIDALDTLFFRDGKPFSLGEETWAEGVFPPSPSVIYGAMRSWYFTQNPAEFAKAGTEHDPTLRLKITNIYFWLEGQPHCVCPLDYVQEQEEVKPTPYLLKLEEVPTRIKTSYALPQWLAPPPAPPMVENIAGMLDEVGIEQYLLDSTPYGSIKPWDDYLQTEPKVGIGRNKNTNSTREGLLYRVGMVRPAYQDAPDDDQDAPTQRLSLIVEYEGLSYQNQGFFKLGGEGKAVHYKVSPDDFQVPSHLEEGQALFKLILNTPAIFRNGWYPEWVNPTSENPATYEGNIALQNGQTAEVTLVAAALGKPLSIGGFDMKLKMPKPMLKAVPAGSVYYFRLTDPTQAPLVQHALHQTSISEHRANEGYGITFFTQPPLL